MPLFFLKKIKSQRYERWLFYLTILNNLKASYLLDQSHKAYPIRVMKAMKGSRLHTLALDYQFL